MSEIRKSEILTMPNTTELSEIQTSSDFRHSLNVFIQVYNLILVTTLDFVNKHFINSKKDKKIPFPLRTPVNLLKGMKSNQIIANLMKFYI